jgi:quercetin dioxygenase-like cupin family protein
MTEALDGLNESGVTSPPPSGPPGRARLVATCVPGDEPPWESWHDPRLAAISAVRWRLLVSAERTATAGMSAGLAEIAPDGVLPLHFHEPPELYHVIAGEGLADVEGITHVLRAGVSLFISGNARHRTANTGRDPLRFLFVFPTDRFEDVTYRFEE